MSANNEYKRYFIILQEDEKGFEFSPGKMPTGYVKIEVKNGKGKLTAFVQNVKSEERLEYRLILVAPGRRVAVDIGKAMIDSSGRGEIYHEFESDNVLGSGVNVSEYTVAAVSSSNGLPLSGYVGRDKLDWKNKYEIVNRPREVRMDKKVQSIQEIPMVQQPIPIPIMEMPMPIIEKNVAPIEEIIPPPIQQPIMAEELPEVELPIAEQPMPVIEKKKAPIQEIPIVEEMPIQIPKVEKEAPIEEIPMEEIPIVEEVPVPAPAPVVKPEAHFHIQPKFELNLQPNIEITHENIMMNQINIEHTEEIMPVEEKQPVPCENEMPCEEEYDYYYCEECEEESEDSDDRPKKHGHHERPKEHEHHDEYEYYEHHSDDDEHHKHEHHSDDCEHDEYDYNPYYSSNMYKHLKNLTRRLRKCEPFHEEDRRCEWFMVQNDIYMLNDVAVPFMGKMMPLGYPFMMEDCMLMSKKDYILGVCHDRDHDHEDRGHIKHIMFGIPGIYNKMNEQYYMSKGFTRFRKHKDRAYGYWIMCLDIRKGMLKK